MLEVILDFLCIAFIVTILTFWLGIEILKAAIKEIKKSFK